MRWLGSVAGIIIFMAQWFRKSDFFHKELYFFGLFVVLPPFVISLVTGNDSIFYFSLLIMPLMLAIDTVIYVLWLRSESRLRKTDFLAQVGKGTGDRAHRL